MKPLISKPIGITIALIVALIGSALIIFHENPLAEPTEELIKKSIACAIILIALIIFIALYDKLMILPQELYQNRKLIWKLAKNDFKTRYAGSYMGMVWAMVQPVVTIVLYYFVFEVVFQNRSQLLASGIEAPYVLWLTAGLVPWFYFSEAVVQGTMALLEYNYLVKKVVFKISILPIIKIIAATFIHIFFTVVMLILYVAYGYQMDWYMIQILYYSLCMFVFVLALSYATCAIVVFFRDLTQIINILLQVGMWATPILWDISMLKNEWEPLQILFKINPVYYVVNGYRSAMFEKTWFWQDFYSTMYFWIVTAVFFGVGALIFKRLKVHFADVM
ncbi:MAG TPA: ABC transporter permease [Lachnospiraceae bacterium]|nr:ABC transporter permease [Lachnospiraceae bacterium]